MKVPFSRAVRLGMIGVILASAPLKSGFANQTEGETLSMKSTGGVSERAFGIGGREARLTAPRVKKSHRHCLEFRTRTYPGWPSGHIYAEFGELDAAR
jgi:hypothetical protein